MMHEVSNAQPAHIIGDLYSLWIEIPEPCPLYCTYCFAESGDNSLNHNNNKENRLHKPDYENIIKDFARIVIDAGQKVFQIALPARGEPFWASNSDIVYHILEVAKKIEKDKREFNNIDEVETIIFTAADLSEKEAKTIAEIFIEKDYRTLLLIKCNRNLIIENIGKVKGINDNRKEDGQYIQDRLAGLTGKRQRKNRKDIYTEKRNRALRVFIDEFILNKRSNKQKRKLGIVTSLVKENTDWLPEYLRWCRGISREFKCEFTFDCDTLLQHGRGRRSGSDPSPDVKRKVLTDLQRIDFNFGRKWPITPTYVGGSCHRFDRHVYVEVDGTVRPCVGGRPVDKKKPAESGVIFAENIHKEYKKANGKTLYKLWKNKVNCTELQTLQDHKYFGTCSACLNFLLGYCHSCIGRATSDLYPDYRKKGKIHPGFIKERGYIRTKGCWNHLDNPIELIDRCNSLISEANDYGKIKNQIEPFWKENVYGDLEGLWSGRGDFKKDISLFNLLERRFPKYEKEIEQFNKLRIFLKDEVKKDIKKEDLLAHVFYYPILRLFVKEEFWEPPEVYELEPQKERDKKRKYLEDTIIRWCIVFIYDDIKGSYFVRTISHPDLEIMEDEREDGVRNVDIARFLIRYFDYNKELAELSFTNKILDLGDVLRNKYKISEYYLKVRSSKSDPIKPKLSDQLQQVILPKEEYDIRSIISNPLIKKRISKVRKEVIALLKKEDIDEQNKIQSYKNITQNPLLSNFTSEIIDIANEDSKKLHGSINKITEELRLGLEDIELNGKVIPGNQLHTLICNYFIWLGAIDPKLKTYEMFYSPPRKSHNNYSRCGIVVATDNKLSNESVYYIRNMLNTLLDPLEDEIQNVFIEKENEKIIRESVEKKQKIIDVEKEKIRVQLNNFYSLFRENFDERIEAFFKKVELALKQPNLSSAFSRCFNISGIKTLTHPGIYTIPDEPRIISKSEELKRICLQQITQIKVAMEFNIVKHKDVKDIEKALKEINENIGEFSKELNYIHNFDEYFHDSHKKLAFLRKQYFHRNDLKELEPWLKDFYNVYKGQEFSDIREDLNYDLNVFFPIEKLTKDFDFVLSQINKKGDLRHCGEIEFKVFRDNFSYGPYSTDSSWNSTFNWKEYQFVTISQEKPILKDLIHKKKYDFFVEIKQRIKNSLSSIFGDIYLLGFSDDGQLKYEYNLGDMYFVDNLDEFPFPLKELIDRNLKKKMGTVFLWVFESYIDLEREQIENGK